MEYVQKPTTVWESISSEDSTQDIALESFLFCTASLHYLTVFFGHFAFPKTVRCGSKQKPNTSVQKRLRRDNIVLQQDQHISRKSLPFCHTQNVLWTSRRSTTQLLQLSIRPPLVVEAALSDVVITVSESSSSSSFPVYFNNQKNSFFSTTPRPTFCRYILNVNFKPIAQQ